MKLWRRNHKEKKVNRIGEGQSQMECPKMSQSVGDEAMDRKLIPRWRNCLWQCLKSVTSILQINIFFVKMLQSFARSNGAH